MIGVSPFKNAINRDVIDSNWCRVIFTWRLVISVGCFALNGYDIQRDTNTYSWIRVLRSSSSRSCRLCNSSSFLSLVTDGDGDVGRGREFTRDDALDGWLTLSCVVLEGDRFLSVSIGFVLFCVCFCMLKKVWNGKRWSVAWCGACFYLSMKWMHLINFNDSFLLMRLNNNKKNEKKPI